MSERKIFTYTILVQEERQVWRERWEQRETEEQGHNRKSSKCISIDDLLWMKLKYLRLDWCLFDEMRWSLSNLFSFSILNEVFSPTLRNRMGEISVWIEEYLNQISQERDNESTTFEFWCMRCRRWMNPIWTCPSTCEAARWNMRHSYRSISDYFISEIKSQIFLLFLLFYRRNFE